MEHILQRVDVKYVFKCFSFIHVRVFTVSVLYIASCENEVFVTLQNTLICTKRWIQAHFMEMFCQRYNTKASFNTCNENVPEAKWMRQDHQNANQIWDPILLLKIAQVEIFGGNISNRNNQFYGRLRSYLDGQKDVFLLLFWFCTVQKRSLCRTIICYPKRTDKLIYFSFKFFSSSKAVLWLAYRQSLPFPVLIDLNLAFIIHCFLSFLIPGTSR